MIEDLEQCRDRFRAADVALEAVILPIRRKYYSDELWERLQEEYLREVKPDI